MKTFVTRTISALVAVVLVYLLYYFWQVRGLKVLPIIAALVGGYELIGILFTPESSKFNRVVFYLFLIFIFVLSSALPQHSAIIFAFFSVCFCLVSLLVQDRFKSLEALTTFQAKSLLGFFYVGLLPTFSLQILNLTHGLSWFLTMLGIVFSGDIGAYITGMLFGKKKLMPMISPKKTIEGSVGGLVFSVVTGLYCQNVLLGHIPTLPMLVLSLACAIAAQFGDLFESQLKRVADVKDSGKIMPGHGGLLDRIDGILFASPILLFGALILEQRL